MLSCCFCRWLGTIHHENMLVQDLARRTDTQQLATGTLGPLVLQPGISFPTCFKSSQLRCGSKVHGQATRPTGESFSSLFDFACCSTSTRGSTSLSRDPATKRRSKKRRVATPRFSSCGPYSPLLRTIPLLLLLLHRLDSRRLVAWRERKVH